MKKADPQYVCVCWGGGEEGLGGVWIPPLNLNIRQNRVLSTQLQLTAMKLTLGRQYGQVMTSMSNLLSVAPKVFQVINL